MLKELLGQNVILMLQQRQNEVYYDKVYDETTGKHIDVQKLYPDKVIYRPIIGKLVLITNGGTYEVVNDDLFKEHPEINFTACINMHLDQEMYYILPAHNVLKKIFPHVKGHPIYTNISYTPFQMEAIGSNEEHVFPCKKNALEEIYRTSFITANMIDNFDKAALQYFLQTGKVAETFVPIVS